MAFTWDVDGNFLTVAQANPSDLSQGRVRLFRGHRSDDEANALLLWAALEHRTLRGRALNNAVTTNQLINGWHTNSLEKFLQKYSKLRCLRHPQPCAKCVQSLLTDSVPKVGVEPTRPCGHWILSPARLPFRHFGLLRPEAIHHEVKSRLICRKSGVKVYRSRVDLGKYTPGVIRCFFARIFRISAFLVETNTTEPLR